MFERFTDGARRVVVLAQEEARLLNHDYIGTEHILLGIVREGDGVGANALESLGIPLEAVRTQVQEIVGLGPRAPSGHIPFTARAKTVLELSLREALQLGHNYIGTEHILLGLIREGEGVGAQVLLNLGADMPRVRAEVIRLLSGYQPPQAARTVGPRIQEVPSSGPGIAAPPGRSCSFCGREFWDLDRYVVGSGAVICDACVDAARQAVAGAPAGERELHLPPRVFGDPPPTPDAVDEIEHVVQAVFGGGDLDACRRCLEDGARLTPLRAQAGARFPQAQAPTVHLDRMRFRGRAAADIRFTIQLAGVAGPVVEGAVINASGRWLVSRDTFCQVMAMAGVTCPPPDEPGH
ncbi:MAG: Clp protease N-terminal domain-containing protein [Acidimicrobiia bacterium]